MMQREKKHFAKTPRLKVIRREVSVSNQKSFANKRCKTSEPPKGKFSF